MRQSGSPPTPTHNHHKNSWVCVSVFVPWHRQVPLYCFTTFYYNRWKWKGSYRALVVDGWGVALCMCLCVCMCLGTRSGGNNCNLFRWKFCAPISAAKRERIKAATALMVMDSHRCRRSVSNLWVFGRYCVINRKQSIQMNWITHSADGSVGTFISV